MAKIIYQVAQLLLRMSRSYAVVWNSHAACWRWHGDYRREIFGGSLTSIVQEGI